MGEATALERSPQRTGDPVVDALVAAAAALFPNALVHSPLLFRLHGVLVEADSLVSV